METLFVQVIGLYKVFNTVEGDDTKLDVTSLKSSMVLYQDSIMYITATEEDEQYGYIANTRYTWGKGILVGANTDGMITSINNNFADNDGNVDIILDSSISSTRAWSSSKIQDEINNNEYLKYYDTIDEYNVDASNRLLPNVCYIESTLEVIFNDVPNETTQE